MRAFNFSARSSMLILHSTEVFMVSTGFLWYETGDAGQAKLYIWWNCHQNGLMMSWKINVKLGLQKRSLIFSFHQENKLSRQTTIFHCWISFLHKWLQIKPAHQVTNIFCMWIDNKVNQSEYRWVNKRKFVGKLGWANQAIDQSFFKYEY